MITNPHIIVIHDHYPTYAHIVKALSQQGFYPHLFIYGEDFFDSWQQGKDDICKSTAIALHKDLGEYAPGMECIDVIGKIREDPLGVQLRTVLCSGEYSRGGVRNESLHVYQADAGYNPVGSTNETPLYVPDKIGKFLRLGLVSPEEAQTFRGKELVELAWQVDARARWIEERLHGNRERA
jgi:hypothetical protein